MRVTLFEISVSSILLINGDFPPSLALNKVTLRPHCAMRFLRVEGYLDLCHAKVIEPLNKTKSQYDSIMRYTPENDIH